MIKSGKLVWISVAAASLVIAMVAGHSLFSFGTDRTDDCDIDNAACTRYLREEGLAATLDITPKPVRTMANLEFQVVLTRDGVSVTDADASLVLTMPGMSMGANTVALAHRGSGMYRGEGVIVKCPSGGKVWQAELMIKGRLPRETQPCRLLFAFRAG